MKVSKKLLCEVLDIDIKYFSIDGTWIEFNNPMLTINIYELAHKCKEWAYHKGYMIDSYAYKVKIISPKYEFEHIHTINGDPKTTKPYDIWRDMEACQWILDNKDKQ